VIDVTTCAIPVTRWKRGVRGIKPEVTPMSDLISCEREPDNSRIGRHTACIKSDVSTMPHGSLAMLSAYYGTIPLFIEASEAPVITVPNVLRGTTVGTERTVRMPFRSVSNRKSEHTRSTSIK
jgi:hypothetical protein